jgi:hypothetical protein
LYNYFFFNFILQHFIDWVWKVSTNFYLFIYLQRLYNSLYFFIRLFQLYNLSREFNRIFQVNPVLINVGFLLYCNT